MNQTQNRLSTRLRSLPKNPSMTLQIKSFSHILYLLKRRNLKQTIVEYIFPIYFVAIMASLSLIPNESSNLESKSIPLPFLSIPCDNLNLYGSPQKSVCLDFVCINCTSEFQFFLSDISSYAPRPLNIGFYQNVSQLYSWTQAPFDDSTIRPTPFYGSPFDPDDDIQIAAAGYSNGSEIQLYSLDLTLPSSQHFGSSFASSATQFFEIQDEKVSSSAFHETIAQWNMVFQIFQLNRSSLYPSVTLEMFINQKTDKLGETIRLPPAGSVYVLFPLYSMLMFLYTAIHQVVGMVKQKEIGIRQLILTMGLKRSCYWISWGIQSAVTIALLLSILLLVGFYSNLFQYSSFSAVFFIYFTVMLVHVAFGFFLSTIFSQTKTAGSFLGLFLSVGALSYFYFRVLYYSKSSFLHFVMGLIFIFPFGELMRNFGILESSQIGVHWSTLSISDPNIMPMTSSSLLVYLWVDIFLYLCATWYCEVVFEEPRSPPLFFLSKSYWLPSTYQRLDDDDSDQDDEHSVPEDSDLIPLAPLDQLTDSSNSDSENISSTRKPNLHRPATVPHPVINVTKIGKSYSAPSLLVQQLQKYPIFSHLFPPSTSSKLVVDKLSLQVGEGDIYVLLGKNGAGKSTTIKMLTGLVTPTFGSATINGVPLFNMDLVRQNLGVVPQDNVFFEKITLEEHIKLIAAIKGIVEEDLQECLPDLLRFIELAGRGNSFCSDLSGGQKRKAHLGMAIVGTPKVYFFDEVSGGMAVDSSRSIWKLIQEISQFSSIILTTHDMREAEYLGTRIGILHHGSIVVEGTVSQLKHHYSIGSRIEVHFSNSLPDSSVLPQTPDGANSVDIPLGSDSSNSLHTSNSSNQGSSQSPSPHQRSFESIASSSNANSLLEGSRPEFNRSTELIRNHLEDIFCQVIPHSSGCTLKFPAALDNKVLYDIVKYLDDNTSQLNILHYQIFTSTLEEVFLRIASS